jgi:hypothetical protein
MPKPSKKALLVGINAYPSQPLRGCVNDVANVRQTLMSLYGLDGTEDIKVITDTNATRKNIVAGLEWLVTSEGEKLFHYSGHGAQLPSQKEPDGVAECLCPVDFDWTEDRALTDKFLQSFLAESRTTIVLDSCFSGGMDRALGHTPGATLARAMIPPLELQLQLQPDSPNEGAPASRRLRDRTNKPTRNLLACEEFQTSADAYIDGRYQGAFTYHLLRELRTGSQTLDTELMRRTASALSQAGFSQHPKMSGWAGKSFMSRMADRKTRGHSRPLPFAEGGVRGMLPGGTAPLSFSWDSLIFSREEGAPGEVILQLRTAPGITWWKSLSVFRQNNITGTREEIQRTETKDSKHVADECSVFTPVDPHDEYTIELWKCRIGNTGMYVATFDIDPTAEDGKRLIFDWRRDY